VDPLSQASAPAGWETAQAAEAAGAASAASATTTKPTRLTLAVVAAVLGLALLETGVALVAPALAPTDAEWTAAAAEVRAGFQPGDLIVAAPAWADPIMRMHLGDLVPATVAGRMDDARFARVWEIAQRGARAPESASGRVAFEARHGALTVRRSERAPAIVTYDFLARLNDAHLSRVPAGGAPIDCPWAGDRFACPDIGFNFVRLQTVEVDTRLRRALLAQPVGGAVVALEYPAVPLGRELVIATGLHDVWMRKAATGVVQLRVLVAGTPAAAIVSSNDTGWLLTRIDTAAYAGRVVNVRFEITSPAPYARHFVLAAEARR
jgi:hypothetical protein